MFNLTNVSLIYFLCIILMQGPNVTKNTSLSCSLSKDYVLFAYPIVTLVYCASMRPTQLLLYSL